MSLMSVFEYTESDEYAPAAESSGTASTWSGQDCVSVYIRSVRFD